MYLLGIKPSAADITACPFRSLENGSKHAVSEAQKLVLAHVLAAGRVVVVISGDSNHIVVLRQHGCFLNPV